MPINKKENEMFKTIFLSTIFATAFIITPVFANDNVDNDQKNLTPARKAKQNKEGQKTYIQGSEQGRTQGTDDPKTFDYEDSTDKNLSPARKANVNDK